MPTEPMTPAKIRRLMRAPAVEREDRNIRVKVAEDALVRLARLRGREAGLALGRLILEGRGR